MRFAFLLLAALYSLLATSPAHAACGSPVGEQGEIVYNSTGNIMQYCNNTNWIAMGAAGTGNGGCANPSDVEGALVYNADNNVLQYCAGAEWVPVGIYGADTTSNLVGHWKLDETSGTSAADSSGNGNTGTLTNFPGSPWTTGQIDGALTFDGTNDYVDGGATGLPAANAPQTFSAWFKYSSAQSGGARLVDTDNAGSSSGLRFGFSCCTGSLIAEQFGGGTLVTSSTVPSNNVWHHLAYTWDGATNALYLDGVLDTTSTTAHSQTATPVTTHIGVGYGGVNYFGGQMDDARVYSRALSAVDVAALYAQGNAGATSALVGRWQFNEGAGTTVADSSGNGTNLTTSGSPTWTTGVEGGAMTFASGKEAADTSPSSAAYVTGSSTVMGWVKMTNIGVTGVIFNGWEQAELSHTQYMRIDVAGSLETLACGGGIYHQSDQLLTAGSWYHVASVWDDATSTINLYINGVLDKSEPDTCTWPGSISDIYLGGDVDGTIDDVRLYNKALSAADIRAAMMEHTNITTGLLAHWGLDESSGTTATDSTGGYNGTLTNFPASPWASGQIDNALTFDGTNDYVEIGDIGAMEGMSAITVSSWVKTTQGTEGHIIDKSRCDGSNGSWELGLGYPGAGYVFFSMYSGASLSQATCGSNFWEPHVNDGVWHYLASTWDGTTVRAFVDGIQCYNPDSAASMDSTAHSVQMGGECNGNPNRLNGSADDIRVYNRALSGPEISALMLTDLPTCSGPNGRTGEIVYNADNTVLQYCNGSVWVPVHDGAKPAKAPRKVFITSTTTNAAFGGVQGANNICQARADAAGLAGSYRAWVATSAADQPSATFTQSATGYVRVDGTKVADTWADLTDGSLDAAIDIDETGTARSTTNNVWTNVATSGAVTGTTAATDSCTNWTIGTNTPSGRRANSSATNGNWTASGVANCNALKRFYWFQQ